MQYFLTWNYKTWPFDTKDALEQFKNFWKFSDISCQIGHHIMFEGFRIEPTGPWEQKYDMGNFRFQRPGDDRVKGYGETIEDCKRQIVQIIIEEAE